DAKSFVRAWGRGLSRPLRHHLAFDTGRSALQQRADWLLLVLCPVRLAGLALSDLQTRSGAARDRARWADRLRLHDTVRYHFLSQLQGRLLGHRRHTAA